MHTCSQAPTRHGSESEQADTTFSIRACVVDADPNIMYRGSNQCTDLNSDEDAELCEEPAKEENADDDNWVDDWDIGELSDEDKDEFPKEIPASVWLSAAKKRAIDDIHAAGPMGVR
jgi:hypothetical protein